MEIIQNNYALKGSATMNKEFSTSLWQLCCFFKSILLRTLVVPRPPGKGVKYPSHGYFPLFSAIFFFALDRLLMGAGEYPLFCYLFCANFSEKYRFLRPRGMGGYPPNGQFLQVRYWNPSLSQSYMYCVKQQLTIGMLTSLARPKDDDKSCLFSITPTTACLLAQLPGVLR